MRKQTKKILSLVMSAAMALSVGAGVDMTKASAADAGFKFQAGDNKEARLVVFNSWGKYDPYGLAGKEVKELSISFDVTGVKDTLTAAGLDKMQAFLGVNSADWGTNTLGETADGKTGVIDIKDDGSYTVAYSSKVDFNMGNQLGVMIPDVMPGLQKDDDNIITGPLKFTNVKFTLDGKEYDTAAAPAEPSVAPTTAPSEAPADPSSYTIKGTARIESQSNSWHDPNVGCTYVDATMDGEGTYTVVSTWEETVTEQNYIAVRCPDMDAYYQYVRFKDITVWIDGKCTDTFNVSCGGDEDCRILLMNNWNPGTIAEHDEVDMQEIKVQFTAYIDTQNPHDFDKESEKNDQFTPYNQVALPDYEFTPATPDPIIDPTPADTKNAAKSVKAAKASVSVKKGKKANLTFKVTAADNKKVTTDKVSATSSNKKVVKVTKVTTKAGKVVVSVKGVKKGSAKVTVKVGSKKATTKVKVK